MSVTSGDLKKIERVVTEFSEKLTVEVEAEVSADMEGVKINLKGKDSALLIGYHGESLIDLAYIMSLIIRRKLEKTVDIRVDVAGYLESKDRKIKAMVGKEIDKVKRSGFPEEISGLNAYERRIAHTIAANEGLISESTGFGKERKLIIKPRGK